MLHNGFKAAAFNICSFILLFGGLYFIDLEGFRQFFGYAYLLVGAILLAYNMYTYYLQRHIKYPGYNLLYAGSILLTTMALLRFSFENWETPLILTIIAVFVWLCAMQLQDKSSFFPKGK
jgi:drug/metabolite transporter (DMT)-like permease